MERIGEMRVHTSVKRIGVAENVGSNLEEILEGHGLTPVRVNNGQAEGDLIKDLNDKELDGMVTRTELNFGRRVLEESGLAVIMGACKDPKVDGDAARELGVETLRSNSNRDAVVRLALAKILGATTGQTRGVLSIQGNTWAKKELGPKRLDARATTLGVYGFGDIGQAVTRVAVDLGLPVIAYNHRSTNERGYDELLRGIAHGMGVELTDKKTRILEAADILSLHIGSRDYRGKNNKGELTTEDLIRFGKGSKRARILINTARRDIVPDEEEILRLINEGVLDFYDTDVFDNAIEREGVFRLPVVDPRFRMAGTPHLGGSEEGLAEETARHVGERLPRWIGSGDINGDSNRYPHQRLESYGLIRPGVLGLQIHRSTTGVTRAPVNDVLSALGLDVLGSPELPDEKPGESEKWAVVPQVFALNNISDIEETCRSIVAGFDGLNRNQPGTVVRVRFMSATPAYQAYLSQNPRLSPNLTEL